MFTSSGLKQRANKELYMVVTNTINGDTHEVNFAASDLPFTEVQALKFDTMSSRGHTWNTVNSKLVAENCESQYCTICNEHPVSRMSQLQ